jgi:hypothetical protein
MRRRSPATTGSRATGSTGFEGAGLDGVITKRADTANQRDTRVMLKIKHVRTVDFVVAGTACKSPPPARLDRLLWRADGFGPRSPSAAPGPRIRLVQLGDQFAPASHRRAEHRPTRARSCRPSTATPARRCLRRGLLLAVRGAAQRRASARTD